MIKEQTSTYKKAIPISKVMTIPRDMRDLSRYMLGKHIFITICQINYNQEKMDRSQSRSSRNIKQLKCALMCRSVAIKLVEVYFIMVSQCFQLLSAVKHFYPTSFTFLYISFLSEFLYQSVKFFILLFNFMLKCTFARFRMFPSQINPLSVYFLLIAVKTFHIVYFAGF